MTDEARLGGVTGLAAAVLEADEVVGRIILFKNESSAGTDLDKLWREVCFFKLAGGGPREGLPEVEVLFKVDGLRVTVDVLLVDALLLRLGERTAPL